MAKWFFEPGHTAAEFSVRHMMVTHVRGHFKNVRGTLVFDPENPRRSSVEATIDAKTIWTGEPQRDDHLRSADFLDVENHPLIKFKSDQVEILGERDYTLRGELTIRGVTRSLQNADRPRRFPERIDHPRRRVRSSFLPRSPRRLLRTMGPI